MNGKILDELWEEAKEQLDMAWDLAEEQFDGMAPTMTPIDDETFYNLFLMRQAEYGVDFARVLDAKKPDGRDLVPGGRNLIRRFLRIQEQKRMAQMARMGLGPEMLTRAGGAPRATVRMDEPLESEGY